MAIFMMVHGKMTKNTAWEHKITQMDKYTMDTGSKIKEVAMAD